MPLILNSIILPLIICPDYHYKCVTCTWNGGSDNGAKNNFAFVAPLLNTLMAAFPRPGFPPEIIEKSLKYLDPLTPHDRQGLAKCLTLSKTYHSIALPLFYETVIYAGNADHRFLDGGIFAPLLTILQDHPLQAALIKNLFLSGYVVYRAIGSGSTVYSPTFLCIIHAIVRHIPSLQSLGLCSLRIQNLCEHSLHTLYYPPPYYTSSDAENPQRIRHLLLHNVTLSTTRPPPDSRHYQPHETHLMQLAHFQHLVAPDAITLCGIRRTSTEIWISPWKHTASTLHLNLNNVIPLNANIGVITQLATIRGLKDFQVWGVDMEVKHGVETIMQRNGVTLEVLALGIDGTDARAYPIISSMTCQLI